MQYCQKACSGDEGKRHVPLAGTRPWCREPLGEGSRDCRGSWRPSRSCQRRRRRTLTRPSPCRGNPDGATRFPGWTSAGLSGGQRPRRKSRRIAVVDSQGGRGRRGWSGEWSSLSAFHGSGKGGQANTVLGMEIMEGRTLSPDPRWRSKGLSGPDRLGMSNRAGRRNGVVSSVAPLSHARKCPWNWN